MASDVVQALAVKQLTLGEYHAGIATDSTGYIIVYDEAGNQRKLMVQA